MNIRQLSVVLENTAGKLHEMTTLLFENDVDIRSIWISEESEFSVVHVIVDKPLVAFDALKQRGYFVKMVEVFALKADDKPGGLMHILEVLKAQNLNIEYVYGFGEKSDGKAIFIFRITDIAKAVQVLKAGHLDYMPTETVENSRKKASSWELIESL